jgi:hypothetical protein
MWALTVEDTHYVGTHSGGHPLCGHSQWRTPIMWALTVEDTHTGKHITDTGERVSNNSRNSTSAA